jgi:sortase (surface protein transpeptidase)
VTVPIDAAATARDGELVMPLDINRAGWWDGSSMLGDPFGSIVIAAHVDSFTQGLGRFVELLSMRPGDRVTVSSAGLTQDFTVVSARLVPKSDLSTGSSIYSVRGAPRLVLITCGGTYDANAGGYQNNMVVQAVPTGAIHNR